MRHRLSIDTSILEHYPTYSLLIIYAEGLTNGPDNAESCALLRTAEQQCRATLAPETLTAQPHIAAWRDVYRSFGAKPKKYPCSLEALLARVLKGQELPQINRLVDIYNTISLKHLLPAGGEDWDRISSELRLTFAAGSEPFVAIQEGQEAVVYPEPGEVIWADSEGVTCRRWNWRQCRRTQLTVETSAAYFVLDRLAPYSVEALKAAGEDLMQQIARVCPGVTLTIELLGAEE